MLELRVTVGVDNTKFDKKPAVKETAKIFRNIHTAEMSICQLSQALGAGQTIRPAVVDKELNFISQSVFALDFDGVPYATAEKIAQETGVYPAIVYQTFSQTPGAPLTRFRMLFVSKEPITNKHVRDAIVARLLSIYDGLADAKCRDSSRMFYGGRNPIINFGCVYDFKTMWADEIAKFGGFDSKKEQGWRDRPPRLVYQQNLPRSKRPTF